MVKPSPPPGGGAATIRTRRGKLSLAGLNSQWPGHAPPLRPLLDPSTLGVGALSGGDQDEIEQCPEPGAAERHELEDCRARLADVEPVAAEEAEEHAEQA